MVSKVISEFTTYLQSIYKKYGLRTTFIFNSDIDMITEYSKNFNMRKLFGENDTLLTEEQIKELNTQNFVLCLYNFSAINKVEDRLNNINFEAVFFSKEYEDSTFKKVDSESNGEVSQLTSYIRDMNDSPNEFKVRDLIMGEIPFSFKLITSDLNLAYNLQMIYLQNIMRNRSINIELNFGKDIEPLELEYQTIFERIENFSQIDTRKYANLYQIDFTGKIQGPLFSSYSSKVPTLMYITPLTEIVPKS